MCGRYMLSARGLQELKELYGPWPLEEVAPRYNIAPRQKLPVVVKEEKFAVKVMRWGLIPFWAKDPSLGKRFINARGETVREKPAFRSAFKRRRCLVPADGFFEWKKGEAGKTPFLLRMKEEKLFFFGGLWDRWKSPQKEVVESFTIITTVANSLVATVHERMPVIVGRSHEKIWLAEESPQEELLEMIKPCHGESMEVREISRRINSPANDDPSVIE